MFAILNKFVNCPVCGGQSNLNYRRPRPRAQLNKATLFICDECLRLTTKQPQNKNENKCDCDGNRYVEAIKYCSYKNCNYYYYQTAYSMIKTSFNNVLNTMSG
eukprot:153773_1